MRSAGLTVRSCAGALMIMASRHLLLGEFTSVSAGVSYTCGVQVGQFGRVLGE